MIKKTITYTDYNGLERTEDFWFHISRAEAIELELSTDGTLTEAIKKIVETNNVPSIVATFKNFILKSYGEKSPDGKHFNKIAPDGHRLATDFEQTEAYSKLFMELVSDPENKAGVEFINGILETIPTQAKAVSATPPSLAAL